MYNVRIPTDVRSQSELRSVWRNITHTVVWECCKNDRQSQWEMANYLWTFWFWCSLAAQMHCCCYPLPQCCKTAQYLYCWIWNCPKFFINYCKTFKLQITFVALSLDLVGAIISVCHRKHYYPTVLKVALMLQCCVCMSSVCDVCG